jgi:hypothetical protein
VQCAADAILGLARQVEKRSHSMPRTTANRNVRALRCRCPFPLPGCCCVMGACSIRRCCGCAGALLGGRVGVRGGQAQEGEQESPVPSAALVERQVAHHGGAMPLASAMRVAAARPPAATSSAAIRAHGRSVLMVCSCRHLTESRIDLHHLVYIKCCGPAVRRECGESDGWILG